MTARVDQVHFDFYFSQDQRTNGSRMPALALVEAPWDAHSHKPLREELPCLSLKLSSFCVVRFIDTATSPLDSSPRNPASGCSLVQARLTRSGRREVDSGTNSSAAQSELPRTYRCVPLAVPEVSGCAGTATR